MGKEIERKFLVDREKWDALEKPAGKLYRQGYLSREPGMTIRIRTTETTGYLTIKGIAVGASRLEYEYEIPYDEANELLHNFSRSELSKIRYEISCNNNIWEVDEFQDDNAGLIIAEIELNSEEQSFDRPDWVAEEVTDDKRYYNSNLTLEPFKDWIT